MLKKIIYESSQKFYDHGHILKLYKSEILEFMRTSIDHVFTFHPTVEGDQKDRIEALYEKAHELAKMICEKTPESSDQEHALRCLKESVLWAKSAILETESKI